MKSPSSKFTASAIAQSAASALELELGRVRIGKPDTIPSGWRMSTEWLTIWKVSPSTAKRLIREHVKSGRMEMRKFRVRVNDGRVVPTLHYRAVR